MTRLLGVAGGFIGSVVGALLIGLFLARVTGASWWVAVGLLGGLLLGIAVVIVAVRPLLRSN